MPLNWSEIRAEFPALERFIYLNTATYGQMALRAQNAVMRHLARRDEHACQDFLAWFDDADEIRELIARIIHCEPTDIAFSPNACSVLSLFLGGIDWREGDRIVTLSGEFPNHYYYASRLKNVGAELIELEAIDSLPARTRAIAISSVNYTSGYRPDLVKISRMARAAGALLYIDGTQSVGALNFDVQTVKPDVLAVDAYKWMLSPNGAAFFYVSPGMRRILEPAVVGWRSDRGWRSVDDLNHGAPQLPDGAERYEGGMLNFPSLYAMGESARMILEIGMERIETRVLQLADRAAEILRGCGAEVLHGHSNIVAGNWPDRDASELAQKLRDGNIVVAARHGNLRVSPHFYNNEADLERFESAVRGLGL
jgi:cysteine desulfurase/selenocysteine lyase